MKFTWFLTSPSVPSPDLFNYVKSWVSDCLRFVFNKIDLNFLFHNHNYPATTFWKILISLFVAGTIINMITGIDGDPSEDE